MRKKLALLICAVLIFICSASVVNAEDETITVTVSVADGMVIPETGLTVQIYSGVIKASSGGGGCDYISYPYEGYVGTFFKKNTSWIGMNKHSFISERQEATFYPGETSRELTFKQINHPERFVAYAIGTYGDVKYIGSGGKMLGTNDTSAELEISYIEGTALSGTVTLPQNAGEETGFTVTAAGNTENRPDVMNDYVFTQSYTIQEGQTSGEYSMFVRPDMDYTVYVVFDGKKYKMQQEDIHIGNESAVQDFTTKEAKKISGTIKIPDGITSFINSDGEETDEIQGSVTLQSADEPHYNIDICFFSIKQGEQSAPFDLYNISDCENAIMYYKLDYDIQGIYCGGDYYDDTKCVPNLKNAAVITPETQSAVINMLGANTVSVRVEDNSDGYDIDTLYAVVLDENGEKYIKVSANKDWGDSIYYLNIPDGYDKYIIAAETMEYYGEQTFYSHNGFTKNIAEADILNVRDNDVISITFDGFDPDIPLSSDMSCYFNEEKNKYYCTVDIDNKSDFDKENITMYTVFYDENNVPERIDSQTIKKVSAHGNVHHEIVFNANAYNSAGSIYMFLWGENSRPLCEKIALKDGLI